MPNTLAHLGAQTLATRAVIRGADLKWIFAGAVIPDVPWILGRATRTLVPALHGYDLWAYLIAQSSLAVSLLLCAALAALAASPTRAFGILALNSLLHLVLDGLQEKWGNRVHILAPVSWDGWSADWFRIESWPTYLLTALGVAVGLWGLRRACHAAPARVLALRRVMFGAALVALYLITPIFLRHGPIRADSNSMGTLRDYGARTGRHVTFDRAPYRVRQGGHYVRTYIGEELALTTRLLPRSTVVSVRATFVNDSTLMVRELREHAGWNRDLLNYVGLMLVALVWAMILARAVPNRGWLPPTRRSPAADRKPHADGSRSEDGVDEGRQG